MLKIISVTASLILSFGLAHANDNYSDAVVRDSVQLGEIIVTGSRPAVNLNNLPMSVTVVGNKQIENRFEQSLLPIITEEVPGLFITSRSVMGYGVAAGAAGGMTIRGIGGSPTTQMLILIDGHPQYMGLMGHPLADSYQSLMAERIEVVRGPASVLYGSNAMGGVINIITKKQVQDGVKTNIRSMYGSYNTFSGEANNSVRSGKYSSYISLNYNHSDGQRENMDFEQYSGYAKLGYDFSPRWKAFADIDLTNFKASNPGTITALIIDNDADIVRGVTSFSLENNYEKTSGALKFYYNFGSHKINDGYTEGKQPKEFRFNSQDKMIGVSLYQTYSLFNGNKTTAGFDYQQFSGHAWNKYPDRDVDIADKSLNDVAGYLNFQQTLAEKVVLNAGLRVDHHEQTGTEWIPQLGLSYIATENTIVKGIMSKGFRNPTIREMYMFPPQNPDLKAERLMNYEISTSHKLLNQSLNFDLSFYYIKGDNSIQTVIVNSKPLNMNTGEIENYGLELSSIYRINSQINLSANYSWLNMKHKVIASPEHKLYAGANYSRNKWNFSTGVQFVHNLYTSVKDETKETFTLWNIRAAYSPTKTFQLFARGENLLAQKYEINLGYPMPRATVFGGINIRL